MEKSTIHFILFLVIAGGCLVYLLGQLDEINEFNKVIVTKENKVSEDILTQAYPNITGKEKVEIIKKSCEKEVPEELTFGSWIFKVSYSSKDCETNFINKIVIEV